MGAVEQYYDAETEKEWARFDRHRTEFAVTLRAMDEFLPPAPARILDIGGGPGRYAIELTRLGYAVTLFDLSSSSLAFARERAAQAGVLLEGYEHGNALDLSRFGDASFDHVLLMGPLYHLTDRVDRLQTLREAARVLAPGGLLFASFITRYAPFRNLTPGNLDQILNEPGETEQILTTGINYAWMGWTDAYFTHPDEVSPFMAQAGLVELKQLGVEGIISQQEHLVNGLEGAQWLRWIDFTYQVAQDPAMRGAADHILYIGRKPG